MLNIVLFLAFYEWNDLPHQLTLCLMGVLLSSVRRLRKDKMSNKVDAQSAYSNIYHERQVKELCAMHAINNLLQKKAFVQKDIDRICTE